MRIANFLVRESGSAGIPPVTLDREIGQSGGQSAEVRRTTVHPLPQGLAQNGGAILTSRARNYTK